MTLSEHILTTLASLPESKKAEALDFVQYLQLKTEKEENREWHDFSIVTAIRGMENEESNYSVADLKEIY